MKKIQLLFILMTCFGFAKSQSIEVENPLAFKWPTADSTISIPFDIVDNDPEREYKVTITDLLSGSAGRIKDYIFSTKVLEKIKGTNSFEIQIKQKDKEVKKTIVLNIKAASDDTVINREIKVTLTNDVTKVRIEDKTNTPKFEFINYTDFKGFDQDQPNGAAQSQFLFKIPINRHYKLLRDGETKTQWFRSFILPNFLFNRIDKTDQPVSLQPTISKYGDDSSAISQVVGTFDFIRYSNFILNSKLTVFTVMRPKSRLQFQLYGSLYKIKVDSATLATSLDEVDSIAASNKVALNPIYASGFGAEIYYDTKFEKNDFPFNFRFILGGQTIKMRSSEYIQADVAVTTPDNTRKTAILLEKSKKLSAPIWSFSAMIIKSLDLSKNSEADDNFLFFRFNYSWQQFKSKVAIQNRPGQYEDKTLNNNFSQFQLGMNLSFEGFFK